jgi:hypothetical protein
LHFLIFNIMAEGMGLAYRAAACARLRLLAVEPYLGSQLTQALL